MENNLTVALIYDFDGTLSPGNMQEYDFIPNVGADQDKFWSDSNRLAEEQDADPILTYMYKMLHSANSAQISLKKEAFRASGSKVKFFAGVEQWFERINRYAHMRGITIEHYINSSGLKEMIEGTSIAHEFKKIYACSFLYSVDGVACWPAVSVNYTNKTQFIFKINKGIETVFDSYKVNQYIPEEQRPVQFKHMIYLGDGTTDIPCMRLVREKGGHAIAVYDPQKKENKQSCSRLIKEDRVSYVCPADYTDGGRIDQVVKTIIDKMETDYKLNKLTEQPARKMVFATNNKHKLEEVSMVLGDSYELITPKMCGVMEEIPEEQPTIEGNALQKAHYLHDRCSCDCFADDTGLEVEVLGGAPGVYSARYAGEKCSFQDNVNKMLLEMDGKENRKACFRTIIALILDGEEYLFEGRVDGEITTEQHGDDGFGYDPIFRPEGFAQTFAQMSAQQKNAISHRGRAVAKLQEFLAQRG